jgi:hypothetical protein
MPQVWLDFRKSPPAPLFLRGKEKDDLKIKIEIERFL